MPARPPTSRLSELIDTSEHGEASAVAALVGDGWTPFVVDVGAYDGRTLSNSFPFLAIGWSGVLVEPLPGPFERLEALYADRGDVRCVRAACGSADGVGSLYVGSDRLTMNASLLPRAGPTRQVTVTTLTSLLTSVGAPAEPAILFVDAEGMDYEVLAGLDFDRFRPRVVVTEDDMRDPPKHAAKTQLLRERGYALYAPVGSAVWVASEVMGDAPGEDGPALDRESALRRVPSEILVRRCSELERTRDQIWSELSVLRASRSWRLTRPLRRLGHSLRAARQRLTRSAR